MSAEFTAQTQPAPVTESERLTLVDVLRGFAIFGILLVNFTGESGSLSPLDQRVETVLDTLIQESFYPLFSFLFGLGIAIQLMRQRKKGHSGIQLHVRRMAVLLLIGTLHGVLIWSGDILVDYAVVGLLLLPVLRLPDRWLLIVVVVLVVGKLEVHRLERALAGRVSSPDAVMQRDLSEWWVNEQRLAYSGYSGVVEREGSYTENVEARWASFGRGWGDWFRPRLTLLNFYLNLDYPIYFLLGMYVGRRRLLENVRGHWRGFAAAGAFGLVATIVGHVVSWNFSELPREPRVLVWMAANLGLTAFYVIAISLIVTRGGQIARLLAGLAPVGRMALTSYLLPSVTMTLLFAPYAMDLERPAVTGHLLLDLAFFFAVILPLSHWWLHRFDYGPVEWFWRSVTYGRAQRMRRESRPEGAATAASFDAAAQLQEIEWRRK